jgi:hypothetical protein
MQDSGKTQVNTSKVDKQIRDLKVIWLTLLLHRKKIKLEKTGLTVFHELPEKAKRKHTAPKLNRKAKL